MQSPNSADLLTDTPRETVRVGFWQRQLPYIVMLVLALGGIAYTNLVPKQTDIYWQLLAPVFAVICVLTQWPRADRREARWRLIWTQALHWGTFLLAMRLMFLVDVQRMLNSNVTGLAILALLALGTFLAGVHAAAWQICIVGGILALAVPAIATLEQAALLLVLLGVVAVGIGGVFFWNKYRPGTTSSTE